MLGKLLGYMKNEVPFFGNVNLDNYLQSIIEEIQAAIITVNGDGDAVPDDAVNMLSTLVLRCSMR